MVQKRTIILLPAVLFLLVIGFIACDDDDRDDSDSPSWPGDNEFIDNGDFDEGTTEPWFGRSSTNNRLLVDQNDLPVIAQSGGYSAWLSGTDNADDLLGQSFEIPPTAYSLKLRFWYFIVSEHRSGQPDLDLLEVILEEAGGSQSHIFTTLSNNNQRGGWTEMIIDLVDLSLWRGKKASLRFHAQADSQGITSFFIDTVSVQIEFTPELIRE